MKGFHLIAVILVDFVSIRFPNLLKVAYSNKTYFVILLEVIVQKITVIFLCTVKSAAKFAFPPLKVQMISIKALFFEQTYSNIYIKSHV